MTHQYSPVVGTTIQSIFTTMTDRLRVVLGVGGKGGEAGRLWCPLLCHGDDDGDVLIADRWSERLQVLHSYGHFSIVEMNAAYEWQPESAVYIPGRLYFLENEWS